MVKMLKWFPFFASKISQWKKKLPLFLPDWGKRSLPTPSSVLPRYNSRRPPLWQAFPQKKLQQGKKWKRSEGSNWKISFGYSFETRSIINEIQQQRTSAMLCCCIWRLSCEHSRSIWFWVETHHSFYPPPNTSGKIPPPKPKKHTQAPLKPCLHHS